MRSALVAGLVLGAAAAAAPAWDPASFTDQSTLQIRTVGREEGEHWSTLWLVVLDGQLYVRLGTRAADRVKGSTTWPYLAVRVAGRQFDRVRAVPAPEDAERVAAAMAAKYWTDVVVRHMSHPLTLRLVPEPEPAADHPR